MKKILFLLLLTVSAYGQTYQNPTYGTVTLKTSPTVNSHPYLTTTESNGVQSKVVSVMNQNANTGLLSGGVISVNTDTTKWDLAFGEGYVVDPLNGTVAKISWGTQTALTTPYLTTSTATYVLISNAGGGIGSVLLQNTPPTQQQYRTHVYLGKLAHTTKTTILFAVPEPSRMFDVVGQVMDLNATLKSINSEGNIISANGTNLNLNVSAGKIYRAGANYASDRNNPSLTSLSSGTAITFRNKFRDGSGGWTAVNTSTVDADHYDDGTGILATVPNNKFTVRIAWRFGSTGTVHLDYGQAVYDNLKDAKESISTAIVSKDPDNVKDASIVGYIVVKKGTTALNNTSENSFYKASMFGEAVLTAGGTTDLKGAYDNSVSPQITTTTTGGAVTIKRGSASDTDNILVGQNGAGTNTFSVTGAGNIAGGTYNGYVPESNSNKSNSYTVSNTTTYPNTKALVDGLAKDNVSKYGILTTNSGAVNSANMALIPPFVDLIFLEGTYIFASEISYKGNNFIGSGSGTVLSFPNSAGIVLDTDYSSSFLDYVINKEFRDLSIESEDECFNFCKYPTIIESFAYSKFINLTLKSELSNAFKSDLVVSGDDFIGYANSFKNIVVTTPSNAVFENMCLAVSTSIDNLHDLNSSILFKNCKLELECTNLNFGFGFNLKHIIYNELSESNYHKATFVNCNFEQMISNPVVNINANSIMNIYFKDSYIQFGTDSNSLVGKQFYAFNPSYSSITTNSIVSDTYATSKQFYPFIGLMTFVDFENSTYRLNTTTVDNQLLSMNIAHIISSSSSLIKKLKQGDYKHQTVYASNENIVYNSYSETEKVKGITGDVFVNVDENNSNISRNYVLANNFIEKPLNITSYSGEYMVSSLIIFNLSSEQEILFDRINKGINSNSTLTNSGSFNVNIYITGTNDPVLLPNHTYIWNQVTKSLIDITEKKAPLDSPALSGTPTAPTSTAGTNTTQIATTAFVQSAIGSASSSGTFTPSSVGSITFSRCYWVKVGNVLDITYNFAVTGSTSYTATMTLSNSFTVNSNSNGRDIGGGKITTNSGYSRLQETSTSSDIFLSITSENTGTANGFARASVLIN